MGHDARAMAHIDQANIACGFHAGDPLVMQNTLALASTHGVMIGAHPAYPDLVGFGRRSLNCSAAELSAMLTYQIAALDGMAQSVGLQLNYVKPHGALYNDMMACEKTRAVIMQTVATYWRPLLLMLQATPEASKHQTEADRYGIQLWYEAFADRCYTDDGKLMPRSCTGAVHSHDQMMTQVKQLVQDGSITTNTGRILSLQADTLCVHGDNDAGISAIQAIRQCL
jgi:UPF0271 protein